MFEMVGIGEALFAKWTFHGSFSFISIAMFEMFDEKGYDEQQSLFLSEFQTGP
jgi:hypothetical protein